MFLERQNTVLAFEQLTTVLMISQAGIYRECMLYRNLIIFSRLIKLYIFDWDGDIGSKANLLDKFICKLY